MHSIKNNTVTFKWSSKPSCSQHKNAKENFVFRWAPIILPANLTPIKSSEEGYANESSTILCNLWLAYHLYSSHILHPESTVQWWRHQAINGSVTEFCNWDGALLSLRVWPPIPLLVGAQSPFLISVPFSCSKMTSSIHMMINTGREFPLSVTGFPFFWARFAWLWHDEWPWDVDVHDFP